MGFRKFINTIFIFSLILLFISSNIPQAINNDEIFNKSDSGTTLININENNQNNINILNKDDIVEYWLQTTDSDFNNGTKININVSDNAFHLKEKIQYVNKTLINNESFENEWPPDGWSESGAWNKEKNQVHRGNYSADFDGQILGYSGNLVSLPMDCSDNLTTKIFVTFWGYDSGSDNGEYYLDYYNGEDWKQIIRLDNFGEGVWTYFKDIVTDNDFFVEKFSIRWRVINLDVFEHVYVDDVNIKVQKKINGYSEDGSLISEAYNTNRDNPIYMNCIVDNKTPNGTSFKLWLRSAKSEEELKNAIWYTEIQNVPPYAWVQWRINLSGDGFTSPEIYSVNLSWIYEEEPPIPKITYVDDDFNDSTPGWEYDHFDSIQEGINAVDINGTVNVHRGIYKENVKIEKPINLIGENKENTIIDAENYRDVVYASNDSINIINFTITNSGGLPNGYAGIRLTGNYCNIINNNLKNNYFGIFCKDISKINITNNTIKNNIESSGIVIINSSDLFIKENNLTENFCGVEIDRSSKINIETNNISNNNRGIVLFYSSYSIIFKNLIEENEYGIRLLYSSEIYGNTSYNNIFENTITKNNNIGLQTDNASNNKIYHNNLINNLGGNAKDSSQNNWDNGYPSGGNFWDDYYGEDIDSDGIGDTPYLIQGGGNKDRFPLMDPYGIDIELPIVQITKPANNYLYIYFSDIFDLKIPFFATVIVGPSYIEVDAFDNDSGIKTVEFYIDNKLKSTDSSPPYRWKWEEQYYISVVELKVRAIDFSANYRTDRINVLKIL